MPAKPQDDYSSTPSVAPTTSAPSDYLSVKAGPGSFGGQVDQAISGAAQQVNAGAKALFDVALQKQGLLNETMQTDAATRYDVASGDIRNQFIQLNGLEPQAQKDQYIQHLQDTRAQIRKTLPNAMAQRGFDLLTNRTFAYAVNDMDLHAANEVKGAHILASNAQMNTSMSNLSDFRVASDPNRSKYELQMVKLSATDQVASKGFLTPGPDGKIKTDANGDPIFSDDENGKMGSAVYHEYLNKNIGQGYYNQIESLAKDPTHHNLPLALQTFERERDSIPPEWQAKIGAMLNPAVKSFQARTIADDVIKEADAGYQKSLGIGADGLNASNINEASASASVMEAFPGATITSTFRDKAKNDSLPGAAKDSKHLVGEALDFVPKDGMAGITKESIEAELTKAGFPFTKVIVGGNAAIGEKPHVHIQWAPGTTPPAGSLNPTQTSPYQTKGDYYGKHYDEIVESARQRALTDNPGDIEGADLAAQHAGQRAQEVFTAESHQNHSDMDLMTQAAMGGFTNGQKLTSEEQLLNSPNSEVQAAAQRSVWQNPVGYKQMVQSILPNNVKQTSGTYGNGFYDVLQKVYSGEIGDNTKLSTYVGNGKGPSITNVGLQKIQSIMGNLGTPEDVAFAHDTSAFLKQAFNDGTGKGLFPGMTTSETLLEKFNTQMPAILGYINQGRQDGKTSAQLFDPTINGNPNPDYVGNHVKLPTKAEANEAILSSTLRTINTPNKGTTFNAGSINNLDDLRSAVAKKQITKDQAIQIGRQKKLFAPEVPRAQQSD